MFCILFLFGVNKRKEGRIICRVFAFVADLHLGHFIQTLVHCPNIPLKMNSSTQNFTDLLVKKPNFPKYVEWILADCQCPPRQYCVRPAQYLKPNECVSTHIHASRIHEFLANPGFTDNNSILLVLLLVIILLQLANMLLVPLLAIRRRGAPRARPTTRDIEMMEMRRQPAPPTFQPPQPEDEYAEVDIPAGRRMSI